MSKNITEWQINEIDRSLIALALLEDLGASYIDATCRALFKNSQHHQTATIISKHPTPITICGLKIVQALIGNIDKDCQLHTTLHDGDKLQPGATLLTIEGRAESLLMLERTILNFLRHLCAVATLTANFVEEVAGTGLKILDTRKTTPGMRHLEKYAVACGGGVNHRMGLYDAIMIKDTHIDLKGDLKAVFAAMPLLVDNPLAVIVEVRDPNELNAVLTHGKGKISRILLDNMSKELLTECARIVKTEGLESEASGNITLSNIKAIATTGVDFASIGMLTHSAGHVDLSMKI